jgi:uncharacterized protein YjiS (DUF1127 family)
MFRSRPKHWTRARDDDGAMTIEALRTVQIKFVTGFATFLREIVRRLGECHQNARTRRQLAELDGRELRDIGLTEAHRQAECRKSFWL